MEQRKDWQQLSQRARLHGDCYIDGRFRPAESGDRFPSINPATEQCLVEVASGDRADIDRAVQSALAAYQAGSWSEAAPAQRKQVMLRLADLVEQHGNELALLDSLDMGKSIHEMVNVDLAEAIDCLRWTAECVDKVYGEIAPTGKETLGLISHEPVGVVGAITPWNFPLLMAVWKLAPALIAGNSLVLKPSEKSSLSILRLAELATEAGLPDGVFNVVTGYGHTAGKALAMHHDVSVLAFTGSTRVGGMLMEYAGQSNMKRVWIEAGGKSPMVVFDDCQDIKSAAETAAAAIFSNQGEVCIACSRLYLQNGIKARFLDALVEATATYQVGDPLDPDTRMGPLVDKAQLDTVSRYIQSAIDEGGRVLCGGLPEYVEGKGFYARPTIIVDAHNEMTFVREEIFGPVLAVSGFEQEEEAIRLANDTPYGLAASIWTDNLSRAHRVSRKIKSGMVWVNGWGEGDCTMPFGGVKASGNGRDKSLHSLDKYTDIKSVWISL